MNKATILSLPR